MTLHVTCEVSAIGGVAAMSITQVGRSPVGGTLRDYRVKAVRQDEHSGRQVKRSGILYAHDRSEPVWELIRKACEILRE